MINFQGPCNLKGKSKGNDFIKKLIKYVVIPRKTIKLHCHETIEICNGTSWNGSIFEKQTKPVILRYLIIKLRQNNQPRHEKYQLVYHKILGSLWIMYNIIFVSYILLHQNKKVYYYEKWKCISFSSPYYKKFYPCWQFEGLFWILQ